MPGLGQLYNREDAKAAAILFSTFGIWAGLVRTSLQHYRRAPFHPVNWRPNLVW